MTALWLALMRWVCAWRGHVFYTVWTSVVDDRGAFSHRAFLRLCGRCDFTGEYPPGVVPLVGRDRDQRGADERVG